MSNYGFENEEQLRSKIQADSDWRQRFAQEKEENRLRMEEAYNSIVMKILTDYAQSQGYPPENIKKHSGAGWYLQGADVTLTVDQISTERSLHIKKGQGAINTHQIEQLKRLGQAFFDHTDLDVVTVSREIYGAGKYSNTGIGGRVTESYSEGSSDRLLTRDRNNNYLNRG